MSCLRELGHDVRACGVKSELSVLGAAIRDFRPHVCFNLVEDFDGIPSRDQHVVSYLELIGQPYTGCNPRGLTLARDKALTKKILSYHGISVPRFAVYPLNGPVRRPQGLPFPLLVKSLTQEGSVGIARASVVYDDEQLEQRVEFLRAKLKCDVIAEQYIDGRELYVGVLGNQKLQTLPVWELCLDALPPEAPRIATEKVKWDEDYRRRHRIRSRAARDLTEDVERQVDDVAREVYVALGLTGYARIDLRLTPEGDVYLLEANPNPQIARAEDFSDSAAAAGIAYCDLIQRIVSLGLTWSRRAVAA
jgi:D-alanine-D-alanine ligase